MICPLAPSSSRGFGQQIGPVRGVNLGHISVTPGYSRAGSPELPFASICFHYCSSRLVRVSRKYNTQVNISTF